jgi:hypothetical protein
MSDRLTITGKQDAVMREIERFEKQMRFASMRAVNNTAFAARKSVRDLIASSFDRPMPKTVALPNVTKRATRDDPAAVIALDYRRFTGSQGYLTPQIEGGKRVPKAFERRLQAIGILPKGMYAVFAKRSGSLNQYGNLSGPKIRQILSYFQAFTEAGFTGNMKAKSIDNLRKGKRKGMKFGMSYFVSTGKRFGALGMRLPLGIWERHYPNGTAGKSFIRPVLLFVQDVQYSKRLDYAGTIERTVGSMLERELTKELARALRTAR